MGIARKPLRTEVLDALIAMIFDRRLRPGDKLGTEVDLARELSVSRNVMREAVRGLSSLGIVEVRHGIGLFVRQPDLAPSSTQLRLSVGMDAGFLEEMLEARRVIELGVVPLVIRNAGDPDLAALEEVLIETQTMIDRRHTRIRPLDLRFHMTLLKASGNRVLARFGGSLVELFTGKPPLEHTIETAQKTLDGHRKIFDALVARDEAGLASALALHLERGEISARNQAREDAKAARSTTA